MTVSNTGAGRAVCPFVATTNDQTANREQQRHLYGLPLGDVILRLTARLDISQARLARTLGMSPPMLCQLVSADRVKISDPGVLARLVVLDRRSVDVPATAEDVDALLREVRGLNWGPWRPGADRPAPRTPTPDHRRAG